MNYSIDAELIKPFLIATMGVLNETDGVEKIKRGKPSLKSSPVTPGLLSGIVDLHSDELTGTFALTFSAKFATALCTNLFKEKVESRNGEEVKKLALITAGELAQYICVRAGKMIAHNGVDLKMTSARGIIGKRHKLRHSMNKPAVQVPFVSNWGTFYVETSLCVSEKVQDILITQMPQLPDIDGPAAAIH